MKTRDASIERKTKEAQLAIANEGHTTKVAASIAQGWPSNGAAKVQAATLLDQPFNDSGNAERLIELYGQDLRFCYAFKKWLVWDGQRWAVDETGQAVKLAKRCMVDFLRQSIEQRNGAAEKFARCSLDARRINSMISMAECEIFVKPTELDTDPYLLNFTNGTVDLKTGLMREHRREDFITKLVHHRYRPDAECPLFLRTLARLMGGGPDASEAELERAGRLVAYLQKAFGYSLTGSTSEKAVFLCHGFGCNGKTTLLASFRQLFEEYSTLIQIDSLMVRQESNNSQADLAALRGARFCMTSETEEGQRLAEGKLKRITQGMGRIKVCKKYENPFEFDETHKLWMDANHLPIIRGTDGAIWNRLCPIPFTVTIPPEEIDRELPDKLLMEGEGILNWAVKGAVRWCAEGLGKPPEVVQANEQYRESMDQVGRFAEECCILLPTAKTKAKDLYAAYSKWCEDSGDKDVLTRNAFGRKLTDRGIEKKHTDAGDIYVGIKATQ